MNILENILSELQKLNKNFDQLNAKLGSPGDFNLSQKVAKEPNMLKLKQMLNELGQKPIKLS